MTVDPKTTQIEVAIKYRHSEVFRYKVKFRSFWPRWLYAARLSSQQQAFVALK